MSKNILIVDDASAIRKVVALALNEAGYNVHEAVDGLDALDKLKSTNVDLMICDVNMPKMDGIEFLDKIKNDEEYSSYRFPPIIMLTTEAGSDMKAKGKELGAKAWLVKPFKPEELIGAVGKLMI